LAVGGQLFSSSGGFVGRVGSPDIGVFQLFHRQAVALVEVVEFVFAENLRERVDVVRFGARDAPGVVAAMAELDVGVDARACGPACIDAGTAQILLHQQ